MTRLERILDGLGAAEDALRPVRDRLSRHKLPHTEDVRLCASLLRCAAATLEGALTLPIESEDARTEVRAPDPPGEELWFRKGDLA